MARVRLADLHGPKWTSSGQNGPKWTILVHFGHAEVRFGIRSFWPKWSFGPFGPFWSSTLSDSTAATPYPSKRPLVELQNFPKKACSPYAPKMSLSKGHFGRFKGYISGALAQKQERKKHINIKKRTHHPPFRTPT